MRRALAALMAAASIALAATHLHAYSGQNAGVFIDLPGAHWCGIEYRGTLGPFCDVS